jgi:PAS domain S-box-containing protein
LETQNSLMQQYFEGAIDFLIAISSDEIVIEINKKGCGILGYPRDGIVGKNWFDNFLPRARREEVRLLFHEMLNGPLSHVHNEYSIVPKDGKERIFSWHNVLADDESGNTIGMLSSGTDVTERRQAERKTKQVENRLQISLDSVIEGYQIIDQDWRYVYINEAAARQGRRTKEELIGKTMMQAYPGIERTPLFNHLQNCMSNHVSHKMENEFIFPDGSRGWFELRIEPVPEGILILSLDISKIKENEAELNKYRHRLEEVVAERTAQVFKANEKLTYEIYEHSKTEEGLKLKAAILDNAREAIFLLNSKGDFAYANEAASRVYGYTVDEFFRLNYRNLLPPEEFEAVELRLREVIEKGQLQLDTVHLRKDKSPMHVQVRHSLIKTQHGQFIVSVIREITA